MLKFVLSLAKSKKISDNWKQQLIDDIAWKIDLQDASPVKKMFDPKELPFKPELTRCNLSTAKKGLDDDKCKKQSQSKKSV